MKSIFNPSDNQEIINRINMLNASSQAKWGKMSVAQMLSHCQVGLQGAMGEIEFKQGLIGFLFGKMAKKQLTRTDIPFKKNLPTDKKFLIVEEKEFETEKNKLIGLVKKIGEGTHLITTKPHPFFGKMTTQEWDVLQWKHLNHHLSQFGV